LHLSYDSQFWNPQGPQQKMNHITLIW